MSLVNLSMTRIWLSLMPFFLAILAALGWDLFQFDSSPSWFYWPALVVLPIIGAFSDKHQGSRPWFLAVTLIPLIILSARFFTPLPDWLLPPFVFSFLVFWILLAQIRDPQAGLIVGSRTLGCIVLGMVLAWVIESKQENLSLYPIVFVATCLIGLTLPILAPPARSDDKPKQSSLSRLVAFAGPEPIFSAAKTTVLLAFMFGMMLGQEQGTWFSLEPLRPHWIPHELAIAILLFALGLFHSFRMGKTFGLRRSFSLCLLLLMLFHLLPWQSLNEQLLLSAGLLFTTGAATGALWSHTTAVLPSSHGGQVLGWFFLALGTGLILSLSLSLSISPLILELLCLVIIQTMPGHWMMRSPNRQLVAENIEPFAWAASPTGLAAHSRVTRFLQLIARTLAEIFFGRLQIQGREHLVSDAPAILVANHPNTFLDPLLITALAPGRLHYWAKSTLWRLPLAGSILDSLGAIPIYRRRDAEGGRDDNQRSMDLAVNKLLRGAHILIFPEGVSEPGLSLKPIKTGVARLGFHFMNQEKWESDLKVIPIALDYSEPTLFRTSVAIRIGKPISLAAFQAAYQQDSPTAVRALTDQLSESLKNMLPHLEVPELEDLVLRVQDLYGERVLQILDQSDMTSARKIICEAVNHYQRMDPDTVYLFARRLEVYYRERERLSTPENHEPIRMKDLIKIMVSLFSFASYGLIVNWLPYRVTGRFVEWFSSAPVWVATAKLTFGTLVFAFYYLLVGLLAYHFIGLLPALLLVLSFCVSAFIALGALERFSFRFAQLRTLWHAFWTQDTNDDLEAMRVELMQDLERFRESYAFYMDQEAPYEEGRGL